MTGLVQFSKRNNRTTMEMFSHSRKEENTGFVSLGDESRCDITGVATVKIKMFDEVVHALGGVAYVPKMQRYLISLGWLDSKGCRYSIISETMKITHGCLVMMKGEKCGDGLYHLMGNTVIGGVPLTSMDSWKQGARNKSACAWSLSRLGQRQVLQVFR